MRPCLICSSIVCIGKALNLGIMLRLLRGLALVYLAFDLFDCFVTHRVPFPPRDERCRASNRSNSDSP